MKIISLHKIFVNSLWFAEIFICHIDKLLKKIITIFSARNSKHFRVKKHINRQRRFVKFTCEMNICQGYYSVLYKSQLLNMSPCFWNTITQNYLRLHEKFTKIFRAWFSTGWCGLITVKQFVKTVLSPRVTYLFLSYSFSATDISLAQAFVSLV